MLRRSCTIDRYDCGVWRRRAGAVLKSSFEEYRYALFRLRNASVMIVGVDGVGAEVAKNIVLSGVAQLTLIDDRCVDDEILNANFFVSAEDKGKKV